MTSPSCSVEGSTRITKAKSLTPKDGCMASLCMTTRRHAENRWNLVRMQGAVYQQEQIDDEDGQQNDAQHEPQSRRQPAPPALF